MTNCVFAHVQLTLLNPAQTLSDDISVDEQMRKKIETVQQRWMKVGGNVCVCVCVAWQWYIASELIYAKWRGTCLAQFHL